MLARFAAIALLVTFASPAFADNVADEAELRFKRGAELYARGRIDEALGEFYISNRLAPNRNVVFNIASCWERLGRSQEAFRYFNDLRADETDPADIRALDAALARLRPKVALVHVETVPPGADIFVEREDLGSQGLSPRTLALGAGATTLIATMPGFRPASVEVGLRRGHQEHVRLELERIWGHVEIATNPTGAEVRLDSPDAAPQCLTPCELRVLPGRHTLYFSADGYATTSRDAEVAADERVSMQATLDGKPAPVGKIVVQANRSRALVKIDGVEAGFTPVVVDATVGRHEVEVSYPDLEVWRKVVDVSEDVSTVVDAKLSVPSPSVSAAAKSLVSADETAASVTVISADEIRSMGWQTLAQALRGVRGLYLSNDRTYDYVGVRGFQPPGDFNTRVLVLVNGHPYNDVWVGQAGIGTDFDVDLSQVERIEVVRGPNSALYGSAAVFGVINVVHRFAPRQGIVELRATGGNQGTGKARVTAGYEGAGWGASVSAAGMQADNAPTTVLNLPDGHQETVRGLDEVDSRHLQVLAKLGKFNLVAVHNDRSKQIPTGAYGTAFNAAGSRSRDQRTFVEGRFEHAFGSGLEVTARGYWDQAKFDGSYNYGDSKSLDEDHAEWAGGEARVRTGSLWGHRLTAGVEAQHWLTVRQFVQNAGAVILDDDRNATVLSGYVHDDWKLHDNFKAELAVRADHYSGAVEQLALAPRGALLGRFYEGGLTKLAVGRAFRVPNIYERYYHDGGQSQKPPTAGSLRPEIILQAELEHTHRLNEDVLVTGGVFASQLSDVLRLETDETDDLLVYRSGTKAIRAVGAEFDLRWQPSRLQLLSFAYSFQLSHDPDSDSALALVNSPRHVAALRGMQPLMRSLAVGFELIWNSPRLGRDGNSYGEALIASVALSGDIEAWGLHYSLSAQNLFNEQYELPVGDDVPVAAVPQYGRTVQLTLAKSFF